MGYPTPQWSIGGTPQKTGSYQLRFIARSGQRRKNSYWALDLLAQRGFLYDSSTAPLHFIGVPNVPTLPSPLLTPYGETIEFPALVMSSPLGNLPIGRGWGLRIFLYRKIQRSIYRYDQLGHPTFLFCHPSDFDPVLSPVHLPWIKRFVCYERIKTTEERMEQVLSDFEFRSIREFLSSKNFSPPPHQEKAKGES